MRSCLHLLLRCFASIFPQQFLQRLRRQSPVEGLVHGNHRRQAAGTDAGHVFGSEFEVLGGFCMPDTQSLLDQVGNPAGAFDVTGGAHADVDNVASSGRQAEGLEEGGDAVNTTQRNIEALAGLLEEPDKTKTFIQFLREDETA